ncbi:cadherin-87A [Octopus bimaculoides]|uniref:Cadherin domain-containing protein n=1 Tax=Octopus bimaculoides TaxID=37653 RepID=A0A0L8HGS3_OCTBM|nr:cadherin-87A [Octopus bimaculoides]|eukprot:XP_014772442.1 PREDICTED: cadherin-87A-like [Octopus bimaculoides]
MSGKFFWLLTLSLSITLSFSQNTNKPPVWRNYLKKLLTEDGLFENLELGTILGQLDAYDPEGADITYECIGESVACYENGTVYLKRRLDRELDIKNPGQNENLLEVIFIATEKNNGDQEPNQNKKTLVIYVKDVNDNPPKFKGLPYKTAVSELVRVGTTIFNKLFVEDIDSGENAEIDLVCGRTGIQASLACDHFSITTKREPNFIEGKYFGEIVVKKSLDYESAPSYIMTILATDRGNPTLSASVNILIDVKDEQDMQPVFEQAPYTFFVKENTKKNVSVGNLLARDGDLSNPRPVVISIVGGSDVHFRVGNTVPHLGKTFKAALISNGNLDRESSTGRYRLNISVTELSNGVPDQTAMAYSYVNIEILDDNDFPPIFQKTLYNMTIPENTRYNDNFTIIGTPMFVYDKDSGINAMFSLQIVSQSFPGVFGLSTDTGIKSAVVNLVLLKPQMLDYDIPKYRTQLVEILAQQTNSTKILKSSTVVYINLMDENDNAPVFQKPIYKASLPENSPVGTTVLTLLATDIDSGINKKIVYKLNGQGSDFFSVSSDGVVTLLKGLDYEKQRTYNLLAIAENIGKGRQLDSVEVEVQITDVNDNGPVFQHQPYTSDITENATTLQPPIKVSATDKDSNSVMTYSIIGGNTKDNAFRIDSKTGHITVARPIMMEDAPQNSSTIFLKILATDNGVNVQSSSTLATINILDINNNSPEFLLPPYEVTVKEFLPGGTSVLTVQAVDKDIGSNAQITYSIKSGSYDNFDIDPRSGKIYVTSQAVLDFDVYSKYIMQVIAEDQGTPRLTGSTNVIINLEDINNKAPKFDRSEYIKTVDEKSPLDSIILRIVATDKDRNHQIEYSLNRNSLVARDAQGHKLSTIPNDYRNAFAINRVTGDITLKMKLYHSLVATIAFEVQARDLNADVSSSNQVTQARVVIITQASQRTQPFFLPETPGQSKKIYEIEVPEDKQVGLLLTTVRAKDPKTDQFVSDYTLAPGGQDEGFFNVTRNGEVILIKELDYENKNYSNPLKFDIIAIADPQRNATAGMVITVKDINDNKPKFAKNVYYFEVKETTRYPNVVGKVLASDNDEGENSRISLFLEGPNRNDFHITESGDIIVNRGAELDHETNKIYNLQVVATDNPTGQVHQKTAVKLTIKVLDENDNRPVFQPSSKYLFSVQENAPAGTLVGQVTAKDDDSNENGRLSYSFITGNLFNGRKVFNIDAVTGEIKTAFDMLNISTVNSFSLTVIATDNGLRRLNAKANVIVKIEFLITKEPRILQPGPGQNARVYENQPNGTYVFQVVARARQDSNVSYSLVSGEAISTLFQIDPISGIITTIAPLDREKQSIYNIVIEAADTLNMNYTSTRQLRVLVLDVDDNRPTFASCSSNPETKQINVFENSPVKTYVTQISGCDKDLFPYNKMAYVWADHKTCTNTNMNAFLLEPLSGVILTNASLDYEKISKYTLCVRVVPESEANSSSPRIEADQIQKITVNVQDKNDNGPQFDVEERFAVIYDKSETGKEVAKVTGTDLDSYLYNKVKYTIEKIKCNIPQTNTLYSTENAFVISRNDGRIFTNLPNYKIFVGSHFIITIRGEDALNSNYYSTMKFLIYVIQPRQQTRLILPDKLDVSQPKSAELISDLNKLGIGTFVIKELSYHQKLDQEGDYYRTALCFVVEKDDQMLSLSQTQELLKEPAAQNVLKIYTTSLEAGSCKPETTRASSWSPMWWVLVAFAIFIFICCIILIIALFLLYKNHKHFMDTEKTSLLN